MNEFKLLQITLKANLEILKMLDTSNNENKNIGILTVIKELHKLCEKIIPIYELEKNKNLA
mgnify:CR=1 FL=1